jgi:hypothetical protein
LFQFCDHPQEELAKFGYRSESKLQKTLVIVQYFGYNAQTYCLNMAISGKKKKKKPQNDGRSTFSILEYFPFQRDNWYTFVKI